jgi:hypothetical protein
MRGLNKFNRGASRIAFVFAFVLLLAVSADAYTVVMRGGRRVEIASRFVVTTSTLTYETAPGIQITLEMAAIDIAATEKANSEPPGSLLRRQATAGDATNTTRSEEEQKPPTPASPARRTITNRDLESSRQRRRQSELAYERKRKELGLPSVEESRRQAALESASIEMELEQGRRAQNESESYWRERASALRTEMAAVDAELAYVRGRIDEGPFSLSNSWSSGWLSGYNTITRGVPFSNFGRRAFGNEGARRAFAPPPERSRNVFVAPHAAGQMSGRVAFGGGATRGQVLINSGRSHPAGPIGFGRSFSVFPNIAVFGSNVPNYDDSYERSALITHFNELAAMRAGLKARWRELEEEARRAGAPPGWLRP